MNQPITKNVVLEPLDVEIINGFVETKGLGGKGFSAALRMIIREWAEMNRVQPVLLDEKEKALRSSKS